MSFTKLFSSITESTVWCEDSDTRVVWITMLAMADKRGCVWGSVPGLAKNAVVSLEACIIALDKFKLPDKWSRSKENEGRRLEEIDGGWRLLNYEKFREMRNEEERKIYKADWIRDKRARGGKDDENVDQSVDNVDKCRPQSTYTEAEAEAYKNITLRTSLAVHDAISDEKSEKVKSDVKNERCPHAKIVEAFHNQCRSLPQLRYITPSRKVKILRLWKINPSIEWFDTFFQYCSESDFLMGRSNDFKASFDWIMKPQNNTKIQEGNYHK